MIKHYSLLGIAILVIILSYFILGQNEEVRNSDIITDMHESKAYESFSMNSLYDNGITLQTPVEGTVIRGVLPEEFDATPGGALKAGEVLVNPFVDADSEILAGGKKEYDIFCAVCHGLGGVGDGTVTKKGFPPPPTILSDKYKDMKDGKIYHIITFGFNNMPAYSSQIEREDRWKIISYIRNLQESSENE